MSVACLLWLCSGAVWISASSFLGWVSVCDIYCDWPFGAFSAQPLTEQHVEPAWLAAPCLLGAAGHLVVFKAN